MCGNRRLLVLFTALLTTPCTVWAQSGNPIFDAKGAQANRGAFAALPFEQIDLASGNIMLSFVDLSLPGNAGRSLRLQRTFNSKPPFQQGLSAWTFGIAGQAMRVRINTANPSDFDVFYMSDGREIQAELNDQGTSWPPTISGTDQFWRYNRQTRQLFTPDGTISTFDQNGRLVETRDPFGNVVELIYGENNQLLIRQRLSPAQIREIAVQLRPTGLPETMTYEGRTWTYEGADGGDAATLPEGVRWTFEYPGTYENPVVVVNTPHNGTVRYEMTRPTYPTADPDGGTYQGSAAIHTRSTILNGVTSEWTFTPAYKPLGEAGPIWLTMTVRAPDQTYTTVRHEYRNGVLVSRSLVQTQTSRFDANDVELEREQLFYQDMALRGTDSSGNSVTAPVLIERRVARDGHEYRTLFGFSTTNDVEFHQPSTMEERVDGVWVRGTAREFDYLTGAYVLGLVRRQIVSEASQSYEVNRSHNSLGFRTSETEPHSVGSGGITMTFTPDAFGNIATVTKANGKSTTFAYSWGQVSQTTTPGVTTTRVINSDGTVLSETIAGRTTEYEYDGLGRVTGARPPAGYQIVTTYGPNSIATSRGISRTTTNLDGFGRPIETVNSMGVRTQTEYDAQGRIRRQTAPFTDTPVWTQFSYDGLGRVFLEALPDGNSRTRSYEGNTITVHDENGHRTVLTYKAFGHPDDVRLTGVLDARDNQWTYTYNVVGNLTSVSGPGGVTRTWVYQSQNPHLLQSETHPESGTVNYTNYDNAGVLKQKTDARGTVFNYGHDGNDRLTSIQAGSEATTISYEPGSDNRQSLTVSGGVSTTFRYDAGGRMDRRTDTLDGKPPFVTNFTWDNNDNLWRVEYPSRRQVDYVYNEENQVRRVQNANTQSLYFDDGRYHPSGALSFYRSGNTMSSTVTFDPQRYWVRSISAGGLMHLEYDYDGVGNVTAIRDSRPNRDQTFTYDSLDRLWTADAPNYTATFAYDAHGNRQTTQSNTYTYEASNPFRLTSMSSGPSGMQYDANGNLEFVGVPNITMTYTAGNQMRTFSGGGTTATYDYDGDDWRIMKVVNGGAPTYYFRGPNGQLLTEWINISPNATVRDYIYAGSRLVAVEEATLPAR
jgi:YD repeat-containing protein